jgi:alpha-tubulin suppressor-like RCC1 family protein
LRTAAFHEFARPEDNVVVPALDGTVWTWGFEAHVLALDNDGFVWTWGAKARSPEKIPGLNLLR